MKYQTTSCFRRYKYLLTYAIHLQETNYLRLRAQKNNKLYAGDDQQFPVYIYTHTKKHTHELIRRIHCNEIRS